MVVEIEYVFIEIAGDIQVNPAIVIVVPPGLTNGQVACAGLFRVPFSPVGGMDASSFTCIHKIGSAGCRG